MGVKWNTWVIKWGLMSSGLRTNVAIRCYYNNLWLTSLAQPWVSFVRGNWVPSGVDDQQWPCGSELKDEHQLWSSPEMLRVSLLEASKWGTFMKSSIFSLSTTGPHRFYTNGNLRIKYNLKQLRNWENILCWYGQLSTWFKTSPNLVK